MRVAVLDLGSNSFHLLVAEAAGDGTVEPVLREREMLHLGGVVARHGELPPADVERAVDTVAYLAELARRSGSDRTYPVATSAIRGARNGPDVLERLGQAAGTPVRTLDGDEEARLGYLGVRASIALGDEPTLVLDLGGGSLELAEGVGEDVAFTTSVELGVSRLHAEFVQDDPLPTVSQRALVERVDDLLEPILDTVPHLEGMRAVALGGTVRALARLVATQTDIWLPSSINQLTVTVDELRRIRDRLLVRTLDERASLKGLKSRRADHIHVAAIVLVRALERLDLREVTVSDWGLREGVILDALHARDLARGEALRASAVERLRRTFVGEQDTPPHVAGLAVRLFDATRQLHGRDDRDRELLRYAATLYDLGETIALRGHHRHAAYLIEHAELRGFSPHEIATLASMARFQRRGGPRTDFEPYDALTVEEQRRCRQLLALLQVADALDRPRDGSVRDVTTVVREGAVQLVLHGDRTDLARTEVARRAELFEHEFATEVHVVDDLDDPSAEPGAPR